MDKNSIYVVVSPLGNYVKVSGNLGLLRRHLAYNIHNGRYTKGTYKVVEYVPANTYEVHECLSDAQLAKLLVK